MIALLINNHTYLLLVLLFLYALMNILYIYINYKCYNKTYTTTTDS